jgi:AcrR family transcriptional regulator
MGIKERKEREREMRRRQIKNAAKEVFLVKGLKSATIEDIAGKAELSPATIYQYFKNKDELYASLNLESLHFLLDEIKKVHKDAELSVEEKIVNYKEAMYKTFQYDPVIFQNILNVQLGNTLSTIREHLIHPEHGFTHSDYQPIQRSHEYAGRHL